LISSSSITPCWALSASAEVRCVRTSMPGVAVRVQDAWGFGKPRPLPASGISTMHWRQAPTGSSSGWSQKRGIAVPIISAARMISVPFGTLTCVPSIVSVTRSGFGATSEAVFVSTLIARLLPW